MAMGLHHALDPNDVTSTSIQRPVSEVRVYGVISIALELCLLLENLLPVLVVAFWKRPRERSVSDKLLASLSAAYVLSALVPTPLGLVSYFHGSWYGGAPACECFQVCSVLHDGDLASAETVVWSKIPNEQLSPDGRSSQTDRHQSTSSSRHRGSSAKKTLSSALSASKTATSSAALKIFNNKNVDTIKVGTRNTTAKPVITTSKSPKDRNHRSCPPKMSSLSNGKSRSFNNGFVSNSNAEPSCSGYTLPCHTIKSPENRLTSPDRGNSSWPETGSEAHRRECANILLFFVFTVTLFISSLPVIGYGPPVLPVLANSTNTGAGSGIRDHRNYHTNKGEGQVNSNSPLSETCDSWLIPTPASARGRTFFVAFLAFGFLNILLVALAVMGAVCLLRTIAKKMAPIRWDGESRYTEENCRCLYNSRKCRLNCQCSDGQCDRYSPSHNHQQRKRDSTSNSQALHCKCNTSPSPCHGVGCSRLREIDELVCDSDAEEGHSCTGRRRDGQAAKMSRSYKMAGLILANQAMWVPALVIVTLQKTGHHISDAAMMYAIMSTSLPGLLNPLLLALLYGDYRRGYLYVLRRVCCCCMRRKDDSSMMKSLNFRSRDSMRLPDDVATLTESMEENGDNDVTSAANCPKGKTSKYTYPKRKGGDNTDGEFDGSTSQSYVVVELPDERTPLQGAATAASAASSSRPIVASLYDEYGELSGAPKTELLSPCGSEECLLNPELFRTHTESVV